MKIKRYVCPDMTHAIRQIREELGPDAVILSSQSVEGGVEIAAAIDYDEAWVSQASSRTESRSTPGRSSAGSRTQTAPTQPGDDGVLQRRRRALLELSDSEGTVDELPIEPKKKARSPQTYAEPGEDSVAGMARELGVLRSMLERQLSGVGWGDMARRDPQRAELFQRLLDMGLTRELALSICEAAPVKAGSPPQSWRNALAVLAHRILPFDGDILTDGGRIALLGPTGVGKTTTIAKLAARFVLRHGVDSVALITTDNFRIGAHEQLSAFAQIMGVPVRAAHNTEDLKSALEHYKDKRLVLIDTAGLSQKEKNFVDQGVMLRSASPQMRLMLVLSCTSQHKVLQESALRLRNVHIDGGIVTKMDEASSLGPVISTLCEHKIPVTYTTNGQRVPEDIVSTRAHSLVTRAVKLSEHNRLIPHGIYQEA